MFITFISKEKRVQTDQSEYELPPQIYSFKYLLSEIKNKIIKHENYHQPRTNNLLYIKDLPKVHQKHENQLLKTNPLGRFYRIK